MIGDANRPVVSRRAIIAAARSSSCPVVGITAPAGYGKTMLLDQWAEVDQRALARVPLDRSADDPQRFVTRVASAFSAAVGAAGDPATTAGELATAMRACPRPFVILMDDVHVLSSPGCHEALATLAAGVPSGSQLVTASRRAQRHLPRLRVAQDVKELTVADLALDSQEAAVVFARTGAALDPTEAERLVQLTGGWPAGVALTALASHDDGVSPLTITGDDRRLADYFLAEVVESLSDDEREFLRRSAVLGRLEGAACDAVLERTDSTGRLRDLERTGFLAPAAPGGHEYRLHPLFGDFLLGELRREDARVIEALHLRASAWYEGQGDLWSAVDHALQTSDHARTAVLMETATPTAWTQGEVARIQRWFAAVGAGVVDAHPQLAVAQTWLAIMLGRPGEAEHWLSVLEARSAGPTPGDPPSLPGDLAMLRSVLCRSGPDQSLRDARKAVEALAHRSQARAQALTLCGEAHLMRREIEDAVSCLREAQEDAARFGLAALAANCRATLASIAMDRGQWHEGGELALAARLGIVDAPVAAHPGHLLIHAQAARTHLHRGDRAAARTALADAMRTRDTATHVRPFMAAKGRLETAKLLWAVGERAGARTVLRELYAIFRERPDLGALGAEFSGLVELLDGADGGGREPLSTPLTPAELRVVPYLPTHLTIGQIAERLFVSRNTVNSEIASVYRKLGVSNRDDAVRRAELLGLVGR